MSDARAQLEQAARNFCNSFANKDPVEKILYHFSNRYTISAYEHGLPSLAPFLGRTFLGAEGVQEYFGLLSKHLDYENMRFKSFIVDAESNRVAVRGEARFTWISTGQNWDEQFSYQLGFDENRKVVSYDVWADSGAAYLASKGLLKQQ